MEIPKDLKYSREHEWVKVEGEVATVGITDYAQDQLGDIVMVELPKEGMTVAGGDAFGVVESVKSVSDVFAPVSGTVIEVNDPLADSPGMINEDCYAEGWLAKIRLAQSGEIDQLMDAKAYEVFLSEQET